MYSFLHRNTYAYKIKTYDKALFCHYFLCQKRRIFVASVDACRAIEMRGVAPRFQYSVLSTRREILKRPVASALSPPRNVYGNVTLPPPSFIVLHGDWRRGSAFRYMDCRAFPRAHYLRDIRDRTRVRPADPRECGKIDERAYTCVTRDTC